MRIVGTFLLSLCGDTIHYSDYLWEEAVSETSVA